VFQALRIYLNNELGNLKDLLKDLHLLLRPRALGVIITFHSLETSAVQNYLRRHQHEYKVLIEGLGVSAEELQMNTASRSGKLFIFSPK
jgi:16S rRNA (cytosine1402-N4)-methyltransferase